MRFTTKVAVWCAMLASVALIVFSIVVIIAHRRADLAGLDSEISDQVNHFLFEYRKNGSDPSWVSQREFEEIMSVSHDPRFYSEVIGAEGKTLARTSSLKGASLGVLPLGRSWTTFGGEKLRALSKSEGKITVRLAADLSMENESENALREIMLIAFLFAFVFVGAGAWFVSRKALVPVRVMAKEVDRITAQRLDQRLPETKVDDEIGHLTSGFNVMLERLERSFRQAGRFSADASHEMKTPLAVLRAGLSELLRSPKLAPEDQEAVAELMDQTGRLTGIVENLLLLSRADAGQLSLRLQPLDLTELLGQLREDFDFFAEEAHIAMEDEVPKSAGVLAEPWALRQAVANLLDNAIKYNRPEGRVKIVIAVDDSTVRLRVGNTGKGIQPGDRARLFDRFVRGQQTADLPGTGLGLSLSRELVRAMGGELEITVTEPDWTEFTLTMRPSPSGVEAIAT